MTKTRIVVALVAIGTFAVAIGCNRGEEEAAAASSELPDVAAAPPQASSADRCLALADEKKWTEALTPCTQAAASKPADLAIRHALQQARAAAGS